MERTFFKVLLFEHCFHQNLMHMDGHTVRSTISVRSGQYSKYPSSRPRLLVEKQGSRDSFVSFQQGSNFRQLRVPIQ